MNEIKTQKCYRCKEVKPLDCFHREKRHKSGHTNVCKPCRQEIHKERYKGETREKHLAQQREKYASSPKVREAKRAYVKEYRSDPENKQRYKEYNRWYSRTARGREVMRRSHRKYRSKNIDKRQAKRAVNNAVLRGDLPKISTQECARCKRKAKNYHHKSYKKEHWLDVTPLCLLCHKQADKERRRSERAAMRQTS